MGVFGWWLIWFRSNKTDYWLRWFVPTTNRKRLIACLRILHRNGGEDKSPERAWLVYVTSSGWGQNYRSQIWRLVPQHSFLEHFLFCQADSIADDISVLFDVNSWIDVLVNKWHHQEEVVSKRRCQSSSVSLVASNCQNEWSNWTKIMCLVSNLSFEPSRCLSTLEYAHAATLHDPCASFKEQ